MKKPERKNSFGQIAKAYQKYRRSYDLRLYKLLYSLSPKKELTILDIGCGTGKSTEPLLLTPHKQKVSVIGIDPDERMLREARLSAKNKKLPIKYVQGTAENLPFKKEAFDVVISGAAFHWYGSHRTVSNIKKILKKDGIIFIFWVQYAKSNHPVIGGDIYQKYHWQGIEKQFRGKKYPKLLLKRGFKKVKTLSISFIEKKTIEDAVGNIKTNSSYALLSPTAQKQFTKEITQEYKNALGSKKYDINRLELHVCYGIKP